MAHEKLRPDIRALTETGLTEKWRKIYGTGFLLSAFCLLLPGSCLLFEGFAISNIRSALRLEFFWTKKKAKLMVVS